MDVFLKLLGTKDDQSNVKEKSLKDLMEDGKYSVSVCKMERFGEGIKL